MLVVQTLNLFVIKKSIDNFANNTLLTLNNFCKPFRVTGFIFYRKRRVICVLRPLIDEGVSEFMFVLGQARLKGAVQMIINPVAMW